MIAVDDHDLRPLGKGVNLRYQRLFDEKCLFTVSLKVRGAAFSVQPDEAGGVNIADGV